MSHQDVTLLFILWLNRTFKTTLSITFDEKAIRQFQTVWRFMNDMQMKKSFLWVSLITLFALFAGELFWAEDACARRGRSFSSRRSSTSSRRSPSKGSSFSTSKKTSYSSRSDSGNRKGSAFNATSKKTSRGTNMAEASKRASSKSKFTSASASGTTAKTYSDVVKDNKALSDTLTPERAETRSARRNAFYTNVTPSNETYYRYAPTVIYHDPYDNFFFRYVTMTWLFHHWDSVDKSRFEEQRLRELEAKMAEMRAQGFQRDSNYTMAGVDPDLQYSDEELANLQDAKDVAQYEEDQARGVSWLTIFLVGMVIVGGIYFTAIRRY